MRGPPLGPMAEGLLYAFGILIVLVFTAHWWGPPLGRALKRADKNLRIVGSAIYTAARKFTGHESQGSTRPHGKR